MQIDRKLKYDKNEVLSAIQGCMGITSSVASRLGCSWHTAHSYVCRWAATRKAFADENERAVDFSESKMFELINNGDGTMIRFHLSTKGRDRGYTTRTELTGADGGPVVVAIGGIDPKEDI